MISFLGPKHGHNDQKRTLLKHHWNTVIAVKEAVYVAKNTILSMQVILKYTSRRPSSHLPCLESNLPLPWSLIRTDYWWYTDPVSLWQRSEGMCSWSEGALPFFALLFRQKLGKAKQKALVGKRMSRKCTVILLALEAITLYPATSFLWIPSDSRCFVEERKTKKQAKQTEQRNPGWDSILRLQAEPKEAMLSKQPMPCLIAKKLSSPKKCRA